MVDLSDLARYVLPALIHAVGVGGTIAWGVISYERTARREAQKPFREQQLALCMELARIVGRIGASQDDDAAEAERAFWRLYWGPLSVIEDQRVRDETGRLARDLRHRGYREPAERQQALQFRAVQVTSAIRNLIRSTWSVDLADLSSNPPHEER
jgi:hypothetical protein